jgi:hypothetical protein
LVSLERHQSQDHEAVPKIQPSLLPSWVTEAGSCCR